MLILSIQYKLKLEMRLIEILIAIKTIEHFSDKGKRLN